MSALDTLPDCGRLLWTTPNQKFPENEAKEVSKQTQRNGTADAVENIALYVNVSVHIWRHCQLHVLRAKTLANYTAFFSLYYGCSIPFEDYPLCLAKLYEGTLILVCYFTFI